MQKPKTRRSGGAMLFQLADAEEQFARMKVVGIGGAGGNAVNRMIQERLVGVEFISVNTDVQALSSSEAHRKIQIGRTLTRGLGSGSKPDVGREAVVENRDDVAEALQGADRSEEHTSELQSLAYLVCRLL